MNIENTWQASSGEDPMLHRLLSESPDMIRSRLPLQKLRRNLVTGIIIGVLVTIAYVPLFFLIHIWQVYAALGTIIAFNIWIISDSVGLYQRTPESISPELSLKQELEKNYNSFRKWWTIQMRLSIFVFPVAATGGFILGGVFGSEKPVEAFLYNPRMLTILGLTLAIVVPLCFLGAKWMFHIGYGKHLKALKALIDELG